MGLRTIPCMLLAATLGAGAAETRAPRTVNPPFPRIGTCYGAGLSWKTWEQGAEWWSKLDLIIGGGYDLHKVAAGTTLTVELKIAVTPRP